MPRLETPLGRDGPIIDVRIWIGPEHKEALKARGLQAPRPLSVPGLLDTARADDSDPAGFGPGDWPSRPRLGEAPILGTRPEERDAPVYLIRMTFGPIEAPDPPKWRINSSVGVTVVSPGALVLIGQDLLATCRFTYDGRDTLRGLKPCSFSELLPSNLPGVPGTTWRWARIL